MIDSELGQAELAAFRKAWADANTPTQRVIIAGRVLSTFGDSVIAGEGSKGWPCEMLRAIARMQGVAL